MSPLTDITRDVFLGLAQEICGAVAEMVGTADRLLKEAGHELSDRDRVLIGLALKMESCFRSLMDDVRSGRGEAMHHLKTMVEAYLYLFLVIADPSETTAKQLVAEVCHQKQKFLADNAGRSREDDLAFWKGELAEFKKEGIERIGKTPLKGLVAHSPTLKQWYSAVYQAACEPAHISDLIDFMPDLDDPKVGIGAERFSEVRARFAIDHGIAIMIDTIKVAVEGNVIGLRMDSLPAFRARYQEIRSGLHVRVDLPSRQGDAT